MQIIMACRVSRSWCRSLRRKICIERHGNIRPKQLMWQMYLLLAVVLTAALTSYSVLRLYGGCSTSSISYRILTPSSPAKLLLDPTNASLPQLDEGDPSTPKPHDQLDGDKFSLIDLQNFTFHMNDPVCNISSPELFVVLITTSPKNQFYRNTIRNTWGMGLHLVFLIGETDSMKEQESLNKENSIHHDLVQGSFRDTYRNLTYKHVMALKWVTYHCPGAKYILKTDDDVFVNTPFFLEYLKTNLSRSDSSGLVLCNVLYNSTVHRSSYSKYVVSYQEYSAETYPTYCTGWVVLYSSNVVLRLYRESQHTGYFRMEDVHVTGTLMARTNFTHTNLGSLAFLEDRTNEMLSKGQLEDVLFCLTQVSNFEKLWALVNAPVTQSTPFATVSLHVEGGATKSGSLLN